MRKFVLFFIGVIFCGVTYSQNITITGSVTYDKKPVSDTKVSIKGSESYTMTDKDGHYSINVPNGSNTLIFEKTGFKISQMQINGTQNTVNITLSPLEGSEIFELSLEDLMNIQVTSVSKRSEPANLAPQTVIVLTADELQKRGYTDIEQVFHDLPGFDITRSVGTEYVQLYQRGYRSNNTNRTLILVDGIEQNDLWSNSAWISLQQSLSEIKQIEVIYGPSSTIYGPNAFLGVVNIITKGAEDIIAPDKKFGMDAQIGYGSWNTKYADVTIATKNDNFSWTLTGRVYDTKMPDFSKYSDWNYSMSDFSIDYYKQMLGTTSDSLALLARTLDSSAFYYDPVLNGILPHYSNTKKDWYIHSKLSIDGFTLGIESYRLIEGYGGWYTDKYELGPDNGGSWGPFNTSVYSKYEKQLTSKLSIASTSTFNVHQLKGNSNEEYYYIGYLNGGLGLSNLLDSIPAAPYWWHAWYNTYSQQFRSELRLNYDPLPNLNIIGGIEYRQSHLQGDYLVGSTDKPEEDAPAVEILGGNHFAVFDIGGYAQITYNLLNNLKFVIASRADYDQVRITGGYGLAFNPKAAIVFSPKNFVFKAIYSEAIKDAGMWDKYGTIPARLLNNPNLPPEKVRNIEIAANVQISKNILFDVSAYNANYSNVIGTAEVTYVNVNGDTIHTTQNQAIGKYQIQGVMGTLTYFQKDFNVYFNFTYTNPNQLNTDGSLTRIGDISSFSCNAGATATFFKKLDANIRLNYVGLRPTGANTTISSNPLSKINPYFLLNAALSYQITKFLNLQLIGDNLLNTEYFYPGVRSANGDYYASKIPGFERNLYLKLTLEF